MGSECSSFQNNVEQKLYSAKHNFTLTDLINNDEELKIIKPASE